MWVLIRHLPQDSAFVRAVRGEEAEWSLGDHLLAAAVDHLAVANWMTATINRDEDAEEIPYPEPLRRPGTQDSAQEQVDDADRSEQRDQGASAAQIAAFIAAG